MRPLDVAVLIKIADKGKQKWYMKDIAYELLISAGEISESINRSVIAGLISDNKKTVNKLALIDFLNKGLQYVFPVKPGGLAWGIETAYSASPVKKMFKHSDVYVWPYKNGYIKGQSVEPLYPYIPSVCLTDKSFYELFSLVEIIRLANSTEHKTAIELLRYKILKTPKAIL